MKEPKEQKPYSFDPPCFAYGHRNHSTRQLFLEIVTFKSWGNLAADFWPKTFVQKPSSKYKLGVQGSHNWESANL